MHLTLSIAGHGHHDAAWRVSTLPTTPSGLPRYDALVRQAQAGLLDGVFMLPSSRLIGGGTSPAALDAIAPDTLPLIGTLVAQTTHIGLGASVDMAHTEPFHTARAFAVLDNLSSGRAAWHVDLRLPAQGDPDFGHRLALAPRVHYERAEEYIGVAMRLWDSWEEGAVVADKAAGIFADDSKIHPIHHSGTHFTVRGPLTAVRPVQGHPVIVVSDMSAAGRRVAARFADVFLGTCGSIEEAAALAQDLRDQAEAHGRQRRALRILLSVFPVLADTVAAARDRAATLDAMLDTQARPAAGHRFIGTPEGCSDLMAAWFAAGVCDGFNLAPAVAPQDMGWLVDGVVPLLQKRGLFRTAYRGATMREHLDLPRPINSFSRDFA
ncbi:MAG: Flavin-dependent oxidoreductase, luciferase family [Rhizobacter sp.]|nr:Flavin-dependent oxidoreductase, luciferase family [Rhizobacter sp.]